MDRIDTALRRFAVRYRYLLVIAWIAMTAFCYELLRNAKTYTQNRRQALNHDNMKQLGKGIGS